jgi:hypothetical protein
MENRLSIIYFVLFTSIVTIFFVSCVDNINEPEFSGVVSISVSTDEDAEVVYDYETVLHSPADSFSHKKIYNTMPGIHEIQFNVPNDSVTYHHNIFVDDTLHVTIGYGLPNGGQSKIYYFSTSSRKAY